MRDYNREQIEAIRMVRRFREGLSPSARAALTRRIDSYLAFRAEVARFQEKAFAEVCTQKCFASQDSACCNREGIATFFADVVVNVLLSSDDEVDALLQALTKDRGGHKCVYLNQTGCLWRLKPIVCEMFLCEHAKEMRFAGDAALAEEWEELRSREKQHTWPDRPVLFDELEELFIQSGYESALMYFHRSPGLLRVKARTHQKSSIASASNSSSA
jgi:hypothetical protein